MPEDTDWKSKIINKNKNYNSFQFIHNQYYQGSELQTFSLINNILGIWISILLPCS